MYFLMEPLRSSSCWRKRGVGRGCCWWTSLMFGVLGGRVINLSILIKCAQKCDLFLLGNSLANQTLRMSTTCLTSSFLMLSSSRLVFRFRQFSGAVMSMAQGCCSIDQRACLVSTSTLQFMSFSASRATLSLHFSATATWQTTTSRSYIFFISSSKAGCLLLRERLKMPTRLIRSSSSQALTQTRCSFLTSRSRRMVSWERLESMQCWAWESFECSNLSSSRTASCFLLRNTGLYSANIWTISPFTLSSLRTRSCPTSSSLGEDEEDQLESGEALGFRTFSLGRSDRKSECLPSGSLGLFSSLLGLFSVGGTLAGIWVYSSGNSKEISRDLSRASSCSSLTMMSVRN